MPPKEHLMIKLKPGSGDPIDFKVSMLLNLTVRVRVARQFHFVPLIKSDDETVHRSVVAWDLI